MTSTLAIDADDAAKVCQRMISTGFMHCTVVLDSTFAVSKGYYTNIDAPTCANEIKTWRRIPRPAERASRDVLSLIIDVFVLDAQGNLLGAARKLRRFELAVCELQDVDVMCLTDVEALTFWLNVFHILSLHTHMLGHRCNSWSKRRKFFTALRYRVCGQELTLRDIKHGILRCNRSPSGWLSGGSPFARAGDRRVKFCLARVDPRVHFALNLGTRSSPTLRVYASETLDDDLHYAAQSYLRKHVLVHEGENAVTLPAPFIDYADDFVDHQVREAEAAADGSLGPDSTGGRDPATVAKSDPSTILGTRLSARDRHDHILRWLRGYLTPERASALLRLIGTPVKVNGKQHDWDYHLSIESHVTAIEDRTGPGAGAYEVGDESRLAVEILQRTHVSMERAREEAEADASRHMKNRGGDGSGAGSGSGGAGQQRRQGGAGNDSGAGRLVELLGAEFDRIVTRFNLQMFALGFVSIVLMIVQLQLAWNPDRHCDDAAGTICPGLERDTTSQVLKGLISLFTLILVARIVSYYNFLKMLQRRKFGFHDTLDLSIPWRRLATEVVVCALHAPPFLDFEVSFWGRRGPFIDDKLGLLVLLRLYLIARVFRDHSTLYHQRKELVAAKGGQIEEVHLLSSFALTVKYLFQRQPGRFLVVTYMSALLLLSYAIYVGERERQPEVFTYANSIWFGITTVTTVGYGREVTETFIGRTCAFFLAVLGLVMSSMFFAAISQKLSPTMYQKYALKWLEDSRFERVSRQVAAAIIQLQWRYFKFQQVKHTMPKVARRRLESMFKLKSWLYSARFQKMRNDHKTGTQTEAFLDYTDLTILRRVTLVDKHLTSRFQWLDNRLHAMLVEVLRAAHPNEDEKAIRNRARAASFARPAGLNTEPPLHAARRPSYQPHSVLFPHAAGGPSSSSSSSAVPGGGGGVTDGAPNSFRRRDSLSENNVLRPRHSHLVPPPNDEGAIEERGSEAGSDMDRVTKGRGRSQRDGERNTDNGSNDDDDDGNQRNEEEEDDDDDDDIDADDNADEIEAKIFGRDKAGPGGAGRSLTLDEEFENALKFVSSEASIDSSTMGSPATQRRGRKSSGITTLAERIREDTALPKTDSAYLLTPSSRRPAVVSSGGQHQHNHGGLSGTGGAAGASSSISSAPASGVPPNHCALPVASIDHVASTLNRILAEIKGVSERVTSIERKMADQDEQRVQQQQQQQQAAARNVGGLPPLIQRDADGGGAPPAGTGNDAPNSP